MAQSEFRIGEVAERAGVSIDTVRYYERRRLLPRAPRTQGGFRVFTRDAVERVRFIKRVASGGAIITAFLASLCCIGPLLFIVSEVPVRDALAHTPGVRSAD